jgi:tryptophan 2,3-dioxygenase
MLFIVSHQASKLWLGLLTESGGRKFKRSRRRIRWPASRIT